MTSLEYKHYWKNAGQTLYCVAEEHLASLQLLKETRTYLQSEGLPEDAAPFLSFSEVKEQSLRSPNEVFSIDYPDLARYVMFGANGSGDPLCIDTMIADQIVYLNHDNHFERIFVNSNICLLGRSLIYYRDFIQSIISPAGSNDLTRRKFSNSEYQRIQQKFTETDPYCLDESSFWQSELDYLLWERENE